ncbi:MAG: hypothetical protein RX318_11865, partial [bacterium]|nr:hypothetical protein [bacterium]
LVHSHQSAGEGGQVTFAALSPAGILAFTLPYVGVTDASYSILTTDRVIGVNRAGAVTVTLPSAGAVAGRTYIVKDESGAAGTNNITVATEGSETIDGSATDVIDYDYDSRGYFSDGTNWFRV